MKNVSDSLGLDDVWTAGGPATELNAVPHLLNRPNLRQRVGNCSDLGHSHPGAFRAFSDVQSVQMEPGLAM
jgi:hypothetical protein